MNLSQFSRRRFILNSLKGFGTVVASSGIASSLTACHGAGLKGSFDYGVASGDPLSDRVILWTRVTPIDLDQGKDKLKTKGYERRENKDQTVWVSWQVAKDPEFKQVVIVDSASTSAAQDFTLKVDAQGLNPNTTYYYRFLTASHTSTVGRTKTLAEGSIDQVKLAVVSCSNYPAGLFHVYAEVAKRNDLDAVLHLGDYLYEYSRDGYASESAAALGREVLPEGELLALQDYRTRYAQYRTDPDLQAAHASAAFIAIWDDHEVANDTWKAGAENHNEGEGDFVERLNAALQAYAEWMPIRPPVDEDISALQRSFQFGDLVNLSMLDTRLVARDEQLNLTAFFDATGNFDVQAYATAISDPSRSLIGGDQLAWLQAEFSRSSTWQVLGQQVLMGVMELPTAVATQQLSIGEFATLAQLAKTAASQPELLNDEQLAYVQANAYLLQLGSLPYNLDAWDGYPVERAKVLGSSLQANNNLVVLAGDTHNAWANNLEFNGSPAGVEFATSSVSSPGLETYLGLDSMEATLQTEGGLIQLIEGLQYANLSDRGYMTVTFTSDAVQADWLFVSSVKQTAYSLNEARSFSTTVAVNSNKIA